MPEGDGYSPPAPPQPGGALPALYDLRASALHHLDLPLAPARRAAWERRLARLEQAICDDETRVASIESWPTTAQQRSGQNPDPS